MQKNDFKARAECEHDAICLRDKLAAVGNLTVKNGDVEASMPALLNFEFQHTNLDIGMPDVELTFSTFLSLNEVLQIIDTIPDSHVMHESLNFAEQYTGERWNSIDKSEKMGFKPVFTD